MSKQSGRKGGPGYDPTRPGLGRLAEIAARKHKRAVREVLVLRDRTVVRVPVGVHKEYDGCAALLGGLPFDVQQGVAEHILEHGVEGVVLKEF